MVACVNSSPTIYGYLSGFVQGADAVYRTLQADRSGQDLLVYPLVYCLRHALELGLKQVIMGARILLEEEEQGFPHDHDLWRLWCTASPVLKRIWPDDGTEPGYDVTERTMLAFSRVDPNRRRIPIPNTEELGPHTGP